MSKLTQTVNTALWDSDCYLKSLFHVSSCGDSSGLTFGIFYGEWMNSYWCYDSLNRKEVPQTKCSPLSLSRPVWDPRQDLISCHSCSWNTCIYCNCSLSPDCFLIFLLSTNQHEQLTWYKVNTLKWETRGVKLRFGGFPVMWRLNGARAGRRRLQVKMYVERETWISAE